MADSYYSDWESMFADIPEGPERQALIDQFLKDYLPSITSDQEQELMGLGMGPAQQDMNAQDPEGTHVGGSFVAANPLQFLATALRRQSGNREWKKGIEGMKGVIGKRGTAMTAIIQNLLRNRQKPVDTTMHWAPGAYNDPGEGP